MAEQHPDTCASQRDQENHAAWVAGRAPRLEGGVVLTDYDPTWPALYDREAARVRDLLGDKVLRLEHIGSTAVPGLAAKPKIDMLLVLADPADEPGYRPELESVGYTLIIREPDWHEHRLFRGPDTDINLHVRPPHSPEIRRNLLFRDWLRASAADRALYERTKRDLAAREWTYMQQYADAKSGVVADILRRAAETC
jgi:GrpB-like predicted nucleotidyltransferase (UPF0157 family)